MKQTARSLMEAVRAQVQAEHLSGCPLRDVVARKEENFPERIRVELTLSCGHGMSRDFGAVRRKVGGSRTVSMHQAEMAARGFLGTEAVRCAACGPSR